MRGRKAMGMAGSVLVHVALLLWASAHERPETPLRAELPAIELVEVTRLDPGALASTHPRADEPGAVHLAEPPPRAIVAEPEDEPPAPRPRLRRGSREPAASPSVPAEPRAEFAAPEPAPRADPRSEAAGSTPTADADALGAASDEGGEGAAGGGAAGEGGADHSAYGAEIVRLVMAEIDDDPVPGIAQGDSITIMLLVDENGRLRRRGDGRFAFATVLDSSLGPLRTRGILRRVERASHRFPRHPDDFPREVYALDFTVRFRG